MTDTEIDQIGKRRPDLESWASAESILVEVDDSKLIPDDLMTMLAPPQKPDELGRLGGYRVLKILGEGGMGYVFLAEDETLQRSVALKVMRPDVIAEENSKERFLREARAAARIKHDNVIMIHQVGEDRGIPFLALEYLEGLPLDRTLREKGEVSLKEAIRIAKEIAAGLEAAHRQGVIHRDIKPANIWLEAPAGRVKILDFGLARNQVEDTHLTRTGEVVGTPAFMSPEQARDHGLDQRSDLFSLGIILYRLCTGRLPFEGATTMAILTALAVDNPVPPCELNRMIPIYLQEAIFRLLEKLPADRYQSAAEVAEALTAMEDRAGIGPILKNIALRTTPAPVAPGTAVASRIAPHEAANTVLRNQNVPLAVSGSRRKHLVAAGLAALLVTVGAILVFEKIGGGRSTEREAAGADNADKNKIPVKARPMRVGPAPLTATVPFDARQARGQQEAWAVHLGDKVELENSIGMAMVLIPPGKFLMGSSEADPDSLPRETPRHVVAIASPFYMGAAEVTQEQYEKVMKKNPSKFMTDQGGGPKFPVERVSWDDAAAFCEELSNLPEEKAAGRVYRLPKEAEWEYACRAGTASTYFHDSQLLAEHAWFKENSSGKPHPVQQLKPNAWGLYDMTGNVWEWCLDAYDEKAYDKAGNESSVSTTGGDRVIRGGSWGGNAKLCRPAYREGFMSGFRNESFGFRVCFVVE